MGQILAGRTHLWAIPLSILIDLCHGHVCVELILVLPRLLSQVCVHLLLAERRHVLDLFVIALYDLPVLRDLLRVQKLVGG